MDSKRKLSGKDGLACDLFELFEGLDIDVCATCGEDREWHDGEGETPDDQD